MELVTGHAGTDHISAADLASMYRGILTDDDVVLASGNRLPCTMTDANTCEIGTGDCFIQAHHCRVAVAEQLAVRSGSAGYNRNDLVVIRYTLGDGNVQDVYLAIKEGAATTSSSPSDPDLVTGDIDGGATMAEFALWRIPIRGINVETPVRIMPTVETLQDQIDGKANTVHNHSGHALAPASVAATGAVSGNSISDGVGTLAALRESVSPKGSFVVVVTFSTVKSGSNYHALWQLPLDCVYSSVSIVGVSAIGGGTPAISESTAFARFVAGHTIDVYTAVDAAAGKSYSLEITLQ